MEYTQKNSNYSTLGSYQSAKCGTGIVAPQISGLPFVSQFKHPQDYKQIVRGLNRCSNYSYEDFIVNNNMQKAFRQKKS